MSTAAATSTGLPPRTAAALAYSAWWITGLLFWFLEREDRFVRFHAAQAVTTFGLVALLIGGFGFCAAASLTFLPDAFAWFLGAALLTWVAGLALWIVAIWKAASGDAWRIPLAADLAEKLI